MITAQQGRTGVYVTASVVEEMMSVNGQNVEMGTHQEREVPWPCQRCPRNTAQLLPADETLSASRPRVRKVPGCGKDFRAQLLWKRGRLGSRRAFKEVPDLLAWCTAAEHPAQRGPSFAPLSVSCHPGVAWGSAPADDPRGPGRRSSLLPMCSFNEHQNPIR